MATPRDGDFYIQRSNQDFFLRKNGVWVREGNIRDEGSTGLVGVQPIMGLGVTLGAEVTRTRFLGDVAGTLGIDLEVLVSRIRELQARGQYGLALEVAVDRVREVTATGTAMGFNMDVILSVLPSLVLLIEVDPIEFGFALECSIERSRELEAAAVMGFSLDAAISRSRFLAAAPGLGFGLDASVDRVKALAASQGLGFGLAAAVDRIKALAATEGVGFSLAAAVLRIKALTASPGLGFALATALTHVKPQVGYLITCGFNTGTSASYFQMYDGTYTAVTGPSGMLTGVLGALAISHDKTKFAVSNASDVKVFSLASGFSTITTLTGILTTNNVSLSWSPDDSRLLIVNSGAVLVYNTSTWTTVTAPSVASSAAVAGDWSPDGTRIGIVCSASPYVRLFDTSTMAGVTNPSSQPASAPSNPSIRFSPDGRWLAVFGSSGVLFVYNRSSSYAKLTDPATMPTGGAGGRQMSIAWKSDGSRFVVGSNGAPRLWSYTISGTTITKETDPATIPTSNSTGGLFVENEAHFVAQNNGTPHLIKYTVTGWVKDTDVTTQPGTSDLIINMDKSF